MSFDPQRVADAFARENAALAQIRADMLADDSRIYLLLVMLARPVAALHDFYCGCGLSNEVATAHVVSAALSMCREHEKELT